MGGGKSSYFNTGERGVLLVCVFSLAGALSDCYAAFSESTWGTARCVLYLSISCV